MIIRSPRFELVAACVVLALTIVPVRAISTSGWVLIPAANTDIITPAIAHEETNDAYVTAELLNSSIYTKDNFWTSVVQGTQHAHLAATATRGSSTVGLALSKTIEIKNKVPAEFGLEKIFFRLLPVDDVSTVTLTFSQLKTADDGVDEAVDKLKPALATVLPSSESAFAVLGIAKTALDALFMKDLNTNRLDSERDLTTQMTPGVYVVFASESSNDYAQYKRDAGKLQWKNSLLTFDGKLVNNVSYYAVKVDMCLARFPSTKAALSSNTLWGPAYKNVDAYIRMIGFGLSNVSNTILVDVTKNASVQVVTMLKLAGDLLEKDQSLTSFDRTMVQAQLETYCENQMKARVQQLAAQVLPSSATTGLKQDIENAGQLRTPLLEKLKLKEDLKLKLLNRSRLQLNN